VNLTDIVGQEHAVSLLTRAIASGRIGHSYLFCGPTGTGKMTTALAFARAINCANRMIPGSTCGECGPCRAFASNSFPDLRIVEPGDDEEDAAKRREIREEKRDGSFHKKTVGEAVRLSTLTASPGHYKVFILEDVHLMTSDAANHFLKMLEEPSPRTVWLLLTSEPGRLLSTIRSRCQEIRFNLLSRPAVESLLRRAGIGGEREAAFMMGQVDQKPADLMEAIGMAEGFLGMAAKFDLAGICGWSKDLAKDTEEVSSLLDGLERVCGEKLRNEPEKADTWISVLDAVARGRQRLRRHADKTMIDSMGAEMSLLFKEGAYAR
jgi:replication-associated recombination protein RarA